ncbi:MAG: G-D-S-L family lipolytic protein [Gammaproteobacteria bacterium]|nr:G-D-S-L family lipolytic protein [Gammaproteobacteria bacterium]
MKIYLRKSLLIITTAIAVAGCGAEISGSLDKDGDAGRGDFSTFVALGDSLSAGYADGALYRQIQENSLPSIMAQQFMLAGGGAFTQPLMLPEKTGSLTLGMTDLGRIDRQMMTATGDPDSPVAPSDIVPTISSDIATESIPGLYNNTSVPGAKSFHLGAAGYGNPAGLPAAANPYFVRFASDPVNSSMLSDALAQAPSFFMLWIGGNDILLYALDGGATNNATQPFPPVPPYGIASTDVTDPAMFTAAFNGAVAALTAAPGTQGLLINIPDVTTIPHFTTVPFNPIPMDAITANAVNMTYDGTYNAGLIAAEAGMLIDADELAQRTIHFEAGDANALVIIDNSLTPVPGLPKIRQATAQDFILLPASSRIGTEATPGNPTTIWGVGTPLTDADVLAEHEHKWVEQARVEYNKTIEDYANGKPDLLFFDAAAKLTELNETGILYGSGGVSSTFAQGGFFSLDGVHPTARGNAVVANEIFKVINAGFDAYIPPVDPSEYTTVFYQ